jgi:hypothetical protein
MTRNAETNQFDALTSAQAKNIADNARPANAPCMCGCGGLTKGRFFPGHDATLKAALHVTVKTGSPAAKKQATRALANFGW